MVIVIRRTWKTQHTKHKKVRLLDADRYCTVFNLFIKYRRMLEHVNSRKKVQLRIFPVHIDASQIFTHTNRQIVQFVLRRKYCEERKLQAPYKYTCNGSFQSYINLIVCNPIPRNTVQFTLCLFAIILLNSKILPVLRTISPFRKILCQLPNRQISSSQPSLPHNSDQPEYLMVLHKESN